MQPERLVLAKARDRTTILAATYMTFMLAWLGKSSLPFHTKFFPQQNQLRRNQVRRSLQKQRIADVH